MTEKRFTYDKSLVAFSKGGINDNVTGETYEFTIDTVLDLLNELQRENEQLKKEYREMEIKVGKLKSEIGELFCENEQLKQFKDNVFCKINMHLQRLPTLRDEEFNSDDEFADPSRYQGAIDILETIKKELSE